MTHKEIFEALLAGKKIKEFNVGHEEILELGNSGYIYKENTLHNMEIDLTKYSYSIFKEPSYQVLYWDNNYSRYAITNRKYISEKAFNEYFHREANRFIRFIKNEFVKLLVDD